MNRQQLDGMCEPFTILQVRDWLIHENTDRFVSPLGFSTLRSVKLRIDPVFEQWEEKLNDRLLTRAQLVDIDNQVFGVDFPKTPDLVPIRDIDLVEV